MSILLLPREKRKLRPHRLNRSNICPELPATSFIAACSDIAKVALPPQFATRGLRTTPSNFVTLLRTINHNVLGLLIEYNLISKAFIEMTGRPILNVISYDSEYLSCAY